MDRRTKIQIKRALSQLHAFKTEQSFIDFGFGLGGIHNNWLVKVQAIDVGLARLVEQLGLEYASTRGKESDISIAIKDAIKKFK